MTMTYAAIPALRAARLLDDVGAQAHVARTTIQRSRRSARKAAATMGMAMTEKQGGSDVRANSTRAVRDGDAYRLTRAQMVLLGADVGRLPHAGAGARAG